MTEEEWTTCSDPELLTICLLQKKISYRKVRLFACAICRRQWRKIPDQSCKAAIEFAERFADQRETGQALANLASCSEQFRLENYENNSPRHKAIAGATWTVKPLKKKTDAFDMLVQTARWMCEIADGGKKQESAAQCLLINDIFGNPFLPFPRQLNTAHRTHAAASLAQAAYEERHLPSGELDPHGLAVLADALEEAGAPGELVAHLRSPGPHVRGCFAVDLCLGLT